MKIKNPVLIPGIVIIFIAFLCAVCSRSEQSPAGNIGANLKTEDAGKTEAKRFAKLLSEQQSSLSQINSEEIALISQIAQWSGQVQMMGGRGETPANYARQCSSRVKTLGGKLGAMKNVLTNANLNLAFNQTLRRELVDKLRMRESSLQDISALLDEAASDFPNLRMFNIPGAIPRLNAKFQAYSKPEDFIGNALREVRNKYELTDADLSR